MLLFVPSNCILQYVPLWECALLKNNHRTKTISIAMIAVVCNAKSFHTGDTDSIDS